jgi:sigma-B regulation protein RsbQ
VESECLILQCAEDFIAPRQVGEYVHRRIPQSELVVLDTTRHCPHLSVPEDVVASMRDFLP